MPKYVVANWKQNKSKDEVISWIAAFEDLIKEDLDDVYVIIAPAHTHLHLFDDISKKIKNFYVGAQDVSEFEDGRNTGKVGARQLVGLADYCIVGHSETGVDSETAFQKGVMCFENGITPILCFTDYKNVPNIPDGLVLAWEDPENISTDKGGFKPKDPKIISEGVVEIKKHLATGTPVLYGGSVNGQNATELSNISELDGVLVGSASLDPEHFYKIVQAFASSPNVSQGEI